MKLRNKIALGIVSTLALLTFIISLEKIPAGHIGIMYNPLAGGVQDKVLTQGLHVINPIIDVTEYSVSTEQQFLSQDKREGSDEDDSFMVATKDKSVRVGIQYSYRFDADKISRLFTRFKGQSGESINDNFIRGNIKTYISSVTSKYSLLEVYSTKRQQVNGEIFKYVKETFAKDGIIIEEVSLIDVIPDEQTKTTMQAQVELQSKITQATLDNERAKIEAQTLIIQAQAKADADSIAILQVAAAQAKANKLLSDSLSDNLVKIKQIEKWNGVQPTTMVGSNTPIIIGK